MTDASLWGDYLKTVLLLIGIILLAWVALRYWLPRTAGFRERTAGPMRMVARYSLEPRKSLYIVEVGEEYFLLGAAENSLEMLTRLDAAKLEPWLSPRPSVEPKVDFRSLFKGWKKQ